MCVWFTFAFLFSDLYCPWLKSPCSIYISLVSCKLVNRRLVFSHRHFKLREKTIFVFFLFHLILITVNASANVVVILIYIFVNTDCFKFLDLYSCQKFRVLMGGWRKLIKISWLHVTQFLCNIFASDSFTTTN